MIFIDATIPKSIADELKKVRDDVVFKHDIFLPGTDDPIWLERVGKEGWLAITHDKHIRTRTGERDAIMTHGVGCFILTHKQNLKKPEILRVVFDYLPEMERRFGSTPRPFIYTVTKNGHFTEYAQRRPTLRGLPDKTPQTFAPKLRVHLFLDGLVPQLAFLVRGAGALAAVLGLLFLGHATSVAHRKAV